jgi:hypothetical protein
MMERGWGDLILRAGAAFAFLYPPLDALIAPDSWIGYVPKFVLSTAHSVGLGDLVVLHSFGALEVVVALWILSGKHILYPCVIGTVILVGIVAFNLAQFEIVFRDLSLAALMFGLAVMHSNRQTLKFILINQKDEN